MLRFMLCLFVICLASNASAIPAGFVSAKRSPNKRFVIFGADDGPIAKVYLVERRKGRFLLDLVFSAGPRPRYASTAWSKDSSVVAVTWKIGNKRIERRYVVTKVLPGIKSADRQPSRYLARLGMLKLADQFGWPKRKLELVRNFQPKISKVTTPQRWLLAATRFYEKGGYLARYLIAYHAKTNVKTRFALDPKRSIADVLAYTVPILLIRSFKVRLADAAKQVITRYFPDQGVYLIQPRKGDVTFGRAILTTTKRNKWAALKLIEQLKRKVALWNGRTSLPRSVVLKLDSSVPPAEIHLSIMP